ncbi:MAG: RHS repeat protein, partial [Nitrospirae bacterium]|nr:RHS repeat protein [Nitrospirota bacterium]
DKLGRVVSTVNAMSQMSSFEYDALGRLKKVTDADGGTVSYTYDANGNRLTMTDPKDNITSYEYDALNRMKTKTEPLGGQYQYVYDAVGDRISMIDANGITIDYAYDELNRLVWITYPDTTVASFEYDANGNMAQMVDGLGTSVYQYDGLNRLTGYTDPFGNTVGYGYDANGNRTSLVYPDGKLLQYGYDPLNRLTSVTDWLLRTTTYTYDAAGRLTGTVNANGTTGTYSYDATGRLTDLTNAKGDSTIISSYTYTLDPLGNHNSVVQDEPLIPLIPAQNITYTHDAENRMTGAGGVINNFDPNGNMTAKGSDTFTYDYNNRLIQSNISGVSTQYSYDGAGNRLVKTIGGATTRYILDINGSLSNILAETDGNGTITAYYVYGLGLISKVLPDGTAYYYHFDSRGSTIALTDASQNITDAYAYDPFGNVVNRTGSTANPFKYVGRYGVMEEGNGLQYIRARYYIPEMGRFITKDPLSGTDGDSQSLNRYVYALNNPVRFVDVSGFWSVDSFAGTLNWGLKAVDASIWIQEKIVKVEQFALRVGNLLGTNSTLPSSLDPTLKLLEESKEIVKIGQGALTVFGILVNTSKEIIDRGALKQEDVRYILTQPKEAFNDLSMTGVEDWNRAVLSFDAILWNTLASPIIFTAKLFGIDLSVRGQELGKMLPIVGKCPGLLGTGFYLSQAIGSCSLNSSNGVTIKK